LQEVGTKTTGRRSTLANKLAQMKSGAEEEVYGAVNMNADKRAEFQVCLSHAVTEATIWSIADTDRIVNSWRERFKVSHRMSRSGSRRNFPSA
jgi:hypothetical protein